eukprot:570187-Pyramimonas_sp.AAC.1
MDSRFVQGATEVSRTLVSYFAGAECISPIQACGRPERRTVQTSIEVQVYQAACPNQATVPCADALLMASVKNILAKQTMGLYLVCSADRDRAAILRRVARHVRPWMPSSMLGPRWRANVPVAA